MPDIGLLQGGPLKPRRPPVRATHTTAASEIEVPPVPVAPEPGPARSAAHAAVVSAADVPLAVLSSPVEAAEMATTSAQGAVEGEPASAPLAAGEPAVAMPPAAAMESGDQEARTPKGPVAASSPPAIRAADLWWLLLALLVIVGSGLGVRDPWPADEPRFASLARDMAHTGEWLFPRVGGDLYQDKPPLYFWLLAASYSLFAWFKGWFLIPSFLAAGGVMFLVYDFGRRTVGREAGLASALLVVCTLQFVLATRGAQIDATLCLLTTFSIYALLRQLLLGHGWRWYFIGGFAAGLGVFTKGVGFLPVLLLLPFFVLRAFGWQGLARLDAGRGGWRWWLAPLAMLLAISLWFVPMLLAVAASGSPDLAAYRDEILFKQTVGRYAAAWHHVKAWYYFLVEVIPPLWLPWSLLLFWLVPRFKSAFRERDARVWLPLCWVVLVILFFSLSPGKRGIYLLPALPVLAMASLPVLGEVLARRGVRIAGIVLAGMFWLAALTYAVGHASSAQFAVEALASANLGSPVAVYAYLSLCGVGLVLSVRQAPLFAWPLALASLAVVFSLYLAPAMNAERSGRAFTRSVLSQVRPGEELGLVAYKEQFLLYLDRPTVNFGHRRWLEGPQEAHDAAAWLNAGPSRVLLVPERHLSPCFPTDVHPVGRSSDDEWFLVRAASVACAEKGQLARAIRYPSRDE
jgi:4-amino-4-deoxy-L-arabinose transferase-like glycosyltransferase